MRILFCVLFCCLFSRVEAETRVGVILPLSGPVAVVGEAAKNSILLADKQFDSNSQVEFLFEDDAYIVKRSMSAAQKLIQKDSVDALLVFGSGPSIAVAELAERKKIPTIAIATSREFVEGKKYVLRHYLNPEVEALSLALEIRKRGYKSIVSVTTLNDALLDVHTALKGQVSALLKSEAEVSPVERDFSTLGTRLLTQSPDAVFLNLMPPQTGILATKLRALGFKGEFFSSHVVEIDPSLKEKNNALKGSWFSAVDDSQAGDFKKSYKETYGIEPAPAAVNGYDIANIFIACASASSLNECIHRKNSFSGALGTSGLKNNSFIIPAQIVEVW